MKRKRQMRPGASTSAGCDKRNILYWQISAPY